MLGGMVGFTRGAHRAGGESRTRADDLSGSLGVGPEVEDNAQDRAGKSRAETYDRIRVAEPS